MGSRSVVVAGIAACLSVCSPALGGETIDPRGVYFHSYTGPSSATEWITIWETEGDRRYEFSDMRGIAPYGGMISAAGQITWDSVANRSGTGQFSTPNRASQTLIYFGGEYASELYRAPGTDAEFITQIDSREDGDASMAGQWRVTVDELDAMTGDLLGTREELMQVDVTGDLLRITGADGAFFQGVFETPDHAGFRVMLPSATAERFRSFDGSITNSGFNVLGDIRYDGADAFSGAILTQSRTPVGPNQHQFVEVYTAVRVPAPGGGIAIAIGMALGARRRRGRVS